MPYIVTTTSHGGRTWYLRKGGTTTVDRNRAGNYETEWFAQRALRRVRMKSDVDSAWHHGTIEYSERTILSEADVAARLADYPRARDADPCR